MSNVSINDPSLIAKLQSESRRCPECDFEVRHPFVERCPRCFHALPLLQLGCPGCVHKLSCPVARD